MSETETQSRIDVHEHGMDRAGTKTSTNRRLFMQLQVFTACTDAEAIAKAVEGSGIEAAVYLDVNDPGGVGLLTHVSSFSSVRIALGWFHPLPR